MEGFFQTELQIIEILIVVSLVAIAVRRVRLPYTVALVLAGLALAFQGQVELTLTPELVLGLFVPPLVFEAAFHLQFRDLRNEIGPILAMAVPGVLVSTAAVGGILVLTGVLPLPVALLFGALISATDPVAVVATFRSVGAPQRLLTLVEGESLFNDGTAVVIFNIVLALVLEGVLDPVQGVIDFVFVSAGGILIGALLGYGISKIIAQIDDYLIEITLTTILAYGSYLLAEEFHVSGVLAVVLAGLVNGNLGPRGMSPTTRIVLFNFWEYIAFLANSFVFLLIGVSVKYDQMLAFLVPGLIAIGAVLVGRALAVGVLGAGVRLFRRDMPGAYLSVMAWGGLRGAISLALVISLPAALAERGQLLAMTFAVVLFTLLVQAMSMPSLLARLGLSGRRSQPVQYERLQGQIMAVRSAVRYLDRLYREGALLPSVYTTVNDELKTRQETFNGQMEELLSEQPELRAQVLSLARLEVLRAERAALDELIHEGLLSEAALADLQAELDEKIGLAGHA